MKKLRSLIATLLSLSIILSMFIFTPIVSAETVEEEVWDGKAATAFAGGTGTETDPYLIENGGQLYKAIKDGGKNSSGTALYYLITKDIYLNKNYTEYDTWMTEAIPANNWDGTHNATFIGHLDGGYHTVYGLFYKGSGQYRAGLIPWMNGGATVSNLIVENAFVRIGGDATGVICGRYGTATISNCIVRDSMIYNRNGGANGAPNLGGIVGFAESASAKITNCGVYDLTISYHYDATKENGANSGGILGRSSKTNATISNCYSAGIKLYGNDGTAEKGKGDYIKDAYIFGATGYIACSNSHSDIAGSKVGVTSWNESPESMKGIGAVAAMKLPAKVWKDSESGYPEFVAYDNTNEGIKGQVWTGMSATKFADGTGTKEDPYIIETAEQLHKAITDLGLKNGVAAYYLITADIYLNEDYANYLNWTTTAPENNWYSVYSGSSFAGHLDGGYHTIYGMYYSGGGSYGGLIPYLSGGSAAVSNLTVTNSYIYKSGDASAIIAGRVTTGTISNCIVHDSYISNGKNDTMGGIVGWASSATDKSAKIKNCGAYNLTFSSGATTAGGILGKSWSSAYKNSYVGNCYSAGKYIFGNTGYINCENSYTDIDQAWKNGVTDNNPALLVGADAVTSMGFDATLWKATEATPTFIYDNSAVKGETWAGERAYHYAGGNGSKADPYIIETAAQLFNAVLSHGMSNDVAAYYKIAADIYLNEDYANYADWATTAPANNWDSAYISNAFIGHLDGGNHTIYGMYARGTDGISKLGLISYLASGGSVSNLTIANAFAHINYSVSSFLVARLSDGTVSKCIVRDSYLSNGNDGSSEVPVLGAIVGYTDSKVSVINNCAAHGITYTSTKEESGWVKGGILGKSVCSTTGESYPRIYSCYSAGAYPLAITDRTWASHNYTDVEGTKVGVKTIEASAMTGAAAETGMSDLDFINIWATTDGYPVIRVASTNNLNFKVTGSYAVTVGGVEGVMFSSKIDMPAINTSYANNIVITVDGVEKIVKEAGLIISRKGIDVTDVSTVKNNPLTGYKVCYTNGGDKSQVVIKGGYIVAAAVVNGNADYIAKSYIVFEDDTVVMTEAYTTAPSTEATTIEGVSINDVRKSGDANFDGEINLKDLVAFKKLAVLGDTFTAKDVVLDIIDTDNDGDFKATDIANFRKTLLAKEYTQNPYGMNLVFEDNFNTTSLDSSKWDFTGYMRGQGVKTVTTPDVQSISAEEDGNGYLHLTSYKAEDGTYKAVKSISTGNKLTFVNGYVEIRAKVPVVQGAWPSFWLKSNTGNTDLGWSSDFTYNTEVDVFEVMGGNTAISNLIKHKYDAETDTTESKQYANSTYASLYGHNGYKIVDNDWHTYGMLWTKDAIEMYVDGVLIMTYNLNKDYDMINGDGMEGFKTQPLCITLNNYLFTPEYAATDLGAWTKDLVVGDDFTESVYDIDYVRLYQDETGILYKK